MLRYSLLVALLCLYNSSYAQTEQSLLTIVIMVKDEESVIQETLLPYLQAGITDYLVYDTGSTDATIEKAQQLFSNYKNINYKIIQEPFIDFAASRNKALDYADNLFNSVFYLMPDAEWYFENAEKLIEFCHINKDETDSSYMISIKGEYISFYIPRLLRVTSHSRFEGPIHEQLAPFCSTKAPHECYFNWDPSSSGIEKTHKRFERDLSILMNEYEKNPLNPHTLFFLGKTYECLKDYKNAYRFYGERSRITTTNHEADFMATYRLALIADCMDSEKESTWPVALYYYMRAYGLHPFRIEPLVRIAQHYFSEDNIPAAYMFIKQACSLPYPEDDLVLVEHELYFITRYELLALCAWCQDNEQEALQALEKALVNNTLYDSVQDYLHALIY